MFNPFKDKKLTDKQLYLSLCKELDDILIKSGIRETCITCSVKCPFKHKADYLKDNPLPYSNRFIKSTLKRKGCCNGCKHLGLNGCTTEALACKLWLCSDKLKQKIADAGFDKRFNEIIDIAEKHGWMQIRSVVDDFFK